MLAHGRFFISPISSLLQNIFYPKEISFEQLSKMIPENSLLQVLMWKYKTDKKDQKNYFEIIKTYDNNCLRFSQERDLGINIWKYQNKMKKYIILPIYKCKYTCKYKCKQITEYVKIIKNNPNICQYKLSPLSSAL